MATVAGILPSTGPESQGYDWFYELQPPDKLPVLDLSLSLKSRFLSRRALNRLDCCIQQRKLIGLTAFSANVSYLVTLLAPRSVGRVASILCLVSWTPIATAGFSSLRYDVIKLLVQTYDFWFLTCVNASAFVVLGVLMGDSRAVALVVSWAGVQINIMVDANIRRVRSWLVFNVLGFAVYVVTWFTISFELIDHMQPFPLVHYRYHELPATSFVTSGLITLIAIIARNVYRRRGVLRRQPHSTSFIECASYRTNLQFYPLTSMPKNRSQIIGTPEEPEYVKPMKYFKLTGRIDGRNTLLRRPILERLTTAAFCFVCPRYRQRCFSWLGVLALLVFASGVHYFLTQEHSHNPFDETSHVVAFVLTLMYCSTCALHYHRTLLLALITSFDFAFLSVQLTALHACSCVIFDWKVESTLTIMASWMWIHWFLCLDALPPVMKRRLGITKGFVVAVMLTLTSTCIVFTYLLMFTDLGSVEMYARVVLDMKLFDHHHVQIKLASVLFNCLATTVALNVRLVWRAVTLQSDVLLVLDGVVVYENYLMTARVRTSRRFGSLKTMAQSLPALTTNSTQLATTQDGRD